MLLAVIKILILSIVSFLFAMFLTPLFLEFMERYGWGKQIREEGVPVFAKLHKEKEGTPTMGGVIIWGTTLLVMVLFWGLAYLYPDTIFSELNFLNRAQTLLPLGVLIFSALVGLVDDLLGVFRRGDRGGGLKVRQKVVLYTLVALVAAFWFYFKLDWDLIHVPFFGDYYLGFWYIPTFVFILVATAFSANETDGLDGLAGGVLLVAFAALGVISFQQGRLDLAAFCGVIVGSLLAFLWYNVYPARFFLGDTGSMGLGITLGVIAMLTNSSLLLPLICFILVIESLSVIFQAAYKFFRNEKYFHSTPIHHHFEALGWHECKITMRFWIVAWAMAGIGLIIGLLG